MKKIVVLILLCIMTFAMTGCSQSMKNKIKEGIEDARDGAKEAIEDLKDEIREDIQDSFRDDLNNSNPDTGLSDGDNALTEMSYYGTWKVEAVAGTSAVYAMSEEDQNLLIGKMLFYDTRSCNTIEGAEITDVSYKTGYITSDELYENYRITFDTLGITDEKVLHVEVEDGFFFGSDFYLVDAYTVIVGYDGVFFRLTRAD